MRAVPTSVRLRHVLDRNDSGVWGEEPTGEGDTMVLRSTEQTMDGYWSIVEPAMRSVSPSEAASSQLEAGDILVTKTSGSTRHIGKATLVDDEVAGLRPAFSNFMQRLRLKPEGEPRYLWRLINLPLVRDQFNLMSTSSTGLANLTGSILGNVSIPWWPIATQRAITDYLDRETAQIDTLIVEQQRLIELLHERRQAAVDAAFVSKPAPTLQLRRHINLLTSGPRGWSRFYSDHGSRFLRIGNLPRTNLSVRGEVQHVTPPENSAEQERTQLRVGDLLFSITAYLGSIAVVDENWAGGYVSQHVALCRLDKSVLDPRFVGWSMLTTEGQDQLKVGAAGGTKIQLALDDIRGLRLPFPAPDEQRRIVAELDDETAKIDTLIAEVERFIELAKERRSALITAAVTGQINIPGAAQ